MNKIGFNCEIITPMFMAGMERSKLELRTPSILGLMRFWWRTLRCNNNLDTLRREEYALFGGSSSESQIRSSFTIRTVPSVDRYSCNNLWDELDHISKISKNHKKYNIPTDKSRGIHYLLYSMCLPERERPYFKQGMPFRIILTSKNLDKLRQVIASLWASIFLGGFGARSRRGGGNVVVTEVRDSLDVLKEMKLSFIPQGQNSKEVADWLIENFKTAQNLIAGNKIDLVPNYSNMCLSRFIISQNPYDNWIESLNDIGKIFADFRNSRKSQILDTATFGLPVRHKKITVKGKLNNEKFERRISPLIFKLLKTENKYYWIVIRLAGKFLPKGSVISAKKTQKPDYNLIDEFWDTLRKNKGNEYVLSLPDKIKEVVEDIVNNYSPKKIVLFGSVASGNFYDRSDIDLGVECEKNVESSHTKGVIDIVDLKRADERLKSKIEMDGVTIYERKS